jgi:hypothetical protein
MKQLTFIITTLFIAACQNNKQPKEQAEVFAKPISDSSHSVTSEQPIEETESICNCKNGNQTFDFKNGNKIALYGEPSEDNSYSEFVISDCKNDSILEDWTDDATVSSIINFKNDTLTIEELYGIPNGKNQEVHWLPFYTTKYYYFQNKLTKSEYYKTNLRKYSQKEIEEVLTNFRKTSENDENLDAYLKSVNQLFWAYYSGSQEAELQLDKIKSKYGAYDGGISEEFDSYIATYEHYKRIK